MAIYPIDGVWYNQLGSEVHFITNTDGLLTGKYKTAVSTPEDFYPLAGRFDFAFPSDVGVTMGWAVCWRGVPPQPPVASTTTWCGQYFLADDVKKLPERIVTQWLLTRSHIPGELWKSTHIGQDTFTRTKPSPEQIAIARALTVGSPHPKQLFEEK